MQHKHNRFGKRNKNGPTLPMPRVQRQQQQQQQQPLPQQSADERYASESDEGGWLALKRVLFTPPIDD